MTRYATVRLLTAAVVALLVVGGTTAAVHAAVGRVGVATILAALLLGVVSFGLLAVVLLFDSRQRHQLGRVLGSLVTSDRLLIRHRAARDDREPRDEQLAEMRRRLDYALEGLWRAVGNGPTALRASSGVAVIEDVSARGQLDAAVREMRPYVATPTPETAPAIPSSPGPARTPAGLPVSPRVAHGAPLVRVSVTRQRQCLGIAAARVRLSRLGGEDQRSIRRAARTRWLIRAVVLLIVPATLAYRVWARTSWLGGVWDATATRGGFLFALALGAVGSVWTVVLTREHGRYGGPRTLGESHALRSRLAAEQLALRLAVGVAPSDAWQVVARSNHFPPGAAVPARAVEEALTLVEQLQRAARRRRLLPARQRSAVIARPVGACVLPAAVIIFLL